MRMRVDFYLLSSDQAADRWHFACQLIEKAWLKGNRVYVHCENKQHAESLDELLWTFRPDSFVPHHLQGEGPEPPPPVQLGYQHEPRGFSDVLVNLDSSIPPFTQRFQRVVEIISQESSLRESARQHYRQYRSWQCELHTHTITI
ncbi:MAG: DNA polymerase III subunit chi [Legionellaceae bacterium]|nr:DNA polymerase III subunit chi [Legionellaceae bacterium]